jgi:hypothetical protein
MSYVSTEKRRQYARDWSMQNNYDTFACGNRKAKKSRQCSDCHAADFPEPNPVSAPEAAWIAGILEGEGCWTTHAGRKNWLVAVRMTDQDIIERLQRLTGIGRVTMEESARGHKTAWAWQISARPHREWLTLTVWPWLGVRRRERILQLWPDIPASQAFSGDVPAFQAGERGFNSPVRLQAPLTQWQSDGLLIRKFWVQVPGGALCGRYGTRHTCSPESSNLSVRTHGEWRNRQRA